MVRLMPQYPPISPQRRTRRLRASTRPIAMLALQIEFSEVSKTFIWRPQATGNRYLIFSPRQRYWPFRITLAVCELRNPAGPPRPAKEIAMFTFRAWPLLGFMLALGVSTGCGGKYEVT